MTNTTSKPVRVAIAVRIDADLREWARATSRNLTATINRLLRQEKEMDAKKHTE